ncbi:MAG: V-type ATPase subunit [Candidatus Bathyarchaeota archaeon]|nr:V-type ATPase subunit [Candidatus Bathyarchaeota archaeon]
MPQTQKYASVLAKIGAERSELLEDVKIKGLVESGNLSDMVAQLRDTSYQEQILHLTPPLTSTKLERAFRENFIETALKIIKYSPKKPAKYLETYLLRLETEHLKGILKATTVNLTTDQKLAKIYVGVEDHFGMHFVFEDAAKAMSVSQVLQVFKDTPYGQALNMGLKSFEETGSTSHFDVFLDKLFFERLYEAYSALPRKERRHAEFYAAMATDSFTLLTLLRGKILNLDPNWLRLVIPQKHFKLKAETVEALVSALDYEAALKIVLDSPYSKFFLKTQDPQETVANAEKAFRKAILQHAKGSIIREIFNIEVTLAFFTLKEAEAHNLTSISLGVDSGVKSEVIRSQLLLL